MFICPGLHIVEYKSISITCIRISRSQAREIIFSIRFFVEENFKKYNKINTQKFLIFVHVADFTYFMLTVKTYLYLYVRVQGNQINMTILSTTISIKIYFYFILSIFL